MIYILYERVITAYNNNNNKDNNVYGLQSDLQATEVVDLKQRSLTFFTARRTYIFPYIEQNCFD